MSKYNLGFVSDEQIFNHVKETVQKYRYKINLSSFNKNLIDPIKLTFDSKVYNKTIQETVEAECIRQIDKTNSKTTLDIFIKICSNWQEMDGKFLQMARTADLMLQTMKNISSAK